LKVSLIYVAIVSVFLIIMFSYITSVVSDKLYSDAENEMLSKSNILSRTVSDYIDDDFSECDNIISQSLVGTGIHGMRFDGSGAVGYDSESSMGDSKFVVMNTLITAALGGEQKCEFSKDEDGELILSTAVPVFSEDEISGAIYLVKQYDGISDIMMSLKIGLLIFSILIALTAGVLGYGMSYVSSMPLNEFVSTAKEISKGNFDKRISVKGNREIDQLAEAMNYMCAELEHLETKRRKFVSDASHELKTPMATIKLVCDSITSTENPDIGMVTEFLSDLSEEVDRLTRIIEKLLFLTKLESEEVNISPELVDFGMMLQRIKNKLTPVAVSKNITITLDTQDDIKPILLDYDRVWEAVYNVVDNAVKYSKIGGNVKIVCTSDEEELVLQVIDCGKGIPDEFKERIFERFYRLDDSRARETGGTGLGLSIAKEVISLHNGKLYVEDNPGGGSCFVMRFPYKAK